MSRIIEGAGNFEGRSERLPLESDWIRGATYQLPMLAGFDPENWLRSLGVRPSGHGETLRQISEGLDQLQAQGFNNLYITGIFPKSQDPRIKGIGTPFCIANHTGIDPQWGTLDDLQFLIAEIHRRKMKIVVDLVLNHTAWDHPWVAQHPDFYMQEGPTIIPGGCSWIDASGEHIMPFTDVAQLDHSNPRVRQALTEVVQELVSWGIDGFRVDMAAQMMNDQLADRWDIPMPPREWLAELIETVRSPNRKKVAFLAESHGEVAPTRLCAAGFDTVTGKADDEAGEQIGWYDALISRDVKSITAAIASFTKARRTNTAAAIGFVGNHDTPAASRVFNDWLKGATALSVFLRPLLWVGSTEAGFDYKGDRSKLDFLEQNKALPLDRKYPIDFAEDPILLAWHRQLFQHMARVFQQIGDPAYQALVAPEGQGWVGYELRSAVNPNRPAYKMFANPNKWPTPSPYGEMPAGACWLINVNTRQVIKLTDL